MQLTHAETGLARRTRDRARIDIGDDLVINVGLPTSLACDVAFESEYRGSVATGGATVRSIYSPQGGHIGTFKSSKQMGHDMA